MYRQPLHDARNLPAARVDDLVLTHAGDELLVYDQRAGHIHHLNPIAAAVWEFCDGRRSVAAVASDVSTELGIAVDAESVRTALRKLADADVLDGPLAADLRGTSRRAFMKKAAVAAAVVVSVSVPQAVAAARGGRGTKECVGEDVVAGVTTCCKGAYTGGKCEDLGTCKAEVPGRPNKLICD